MARYLWTSIERRPFVILVGGRRRVVLLHLYRWGLQIVIDWEKALKESR